jgi:hypothetical protein
VEQGSHHDLLAADGLYARMWALQQAEEEGRGDTGELAAGRPVSLQAPPGDLAPTNA